MGEVALSEFSSHSLLMILEMFILVHSSCLASLAVSMSEFH